MAVQILDLVGEAPVGFRGGRDFLLTSEEIKRRDDGEEK